MGRNRCLRLFRRCGQMTISLIHAKIKPRTTMKKPIIMVIVALLVPQYIQAQGTTTYLSNLSQASAGSFAIGRNSWYAAGFETGNNASGYSVNSIQLLMTGAYGNP